MLNKSKTVYNVIKIINYFIEKKRPAGILEISRNVKINSSTTQRIINTLLSEKLLSQDLESKKYFLGLKFLEISKVIMDELNLRKIAHPYLKELRDITQETVHLMILDDSMGVYIDTLESYQRIKVVTPIGTRDELHFSAIGKAILAYLTNDELEKIVKLKGLKKTTKNTITDFEELKKELSQIRAQGYSIDDEEGEIGTKCIGAPIFRHDGKVDTSISLAAPSHRLTKEKMRQYIPLISETANTISKEVGYLE